MRIKSNISPIIFWTFFLLVVFSSVWYLAEGQIEINQYVGEYYMGDGFFACKLTLRANRTFSILFVQDNSVSREFGGTFSVDREHIDLYPSEQAVAQGICYAKKFIRVEWENRRYLFLHDNDERSNNLRIQFCQNVLRKLELDRERQGSYYMYINVTDKEKIGTSEITESSPTITSGSLFCQEQ